MRTMLVALVVTMMFVVTGCEDSERAKRKHEYKMELLKHGYYSAYGYCVWRLDDMPAEDPNTVK